MLLVGIRVLWALCFECCFECCFEAFFSSFLFFFSLFVDILAMNSVMNAMNAMTYLQNSVAALLSLSCLFLVGNTTINGDCVSASSAES